MQKVLVTGGAGFIGGYVVEELLSRGHEVLILDHVAKRRESYREGVEVIFGDIRDDTAVMEAMAHVDGFIHLAGVLGTQETIQKPLPAVLTNITGGLNILEAAAHYDVPGVNIAVGNHWENNPYSISKSTVERFVHMYVKERQARVSVVRALNAYGPRQSVAAPYGTSKVRKIMPSFIMRALHGDPIQVYGDGNQIMDMIYVSDVAEVLVSALMHTAARGPLEHAIEAGTGRETSVLAIANEVVRAVGQGYIEHLPLRGGETPGAVVLADPSFMEMELGMKASGLVPLEQGVKATVEYYRKLVTE